MTDTKKTTRVETSPTGPAAAGADAAELDRLRAENADLRAQLRRARDDANDPDPGPAQPERPSFGLSAGEANDLRQHGVTTSPFTGERLTASGEGIEPSNDDARKRDERASAADNDRDDDPAA